MTRFGPGEGPLVLTRQGSVGADVALKVLEDREPPAAGEQVGVAAVLQCWVVAHGVVGVEETRSENISDHYVHRVVVMRKQNADDSRA